MNFIEQLFNDYGYLVIFIGLLLEFIALPFPGETSMAYSGYLSYEGKLNWAILVILAFLGTTIGISITYWIGYKVGMPFFERYGKWVLLTPAKLNKAKGWFERYGNWVLFIAYFIPGVRHVTGYFSGVVRLPFRTFAIYAYSGAIFWVIIFIFLGKIFGPQWHQLFDLFESYAKKTIIAGIILLVAYLIFRFRKKLIQLLKRMVG